MGVQGEAAKKLKGNFGVANLFFLSSYLSLMAASVHQPKTRFDCPRRPLEKTCLKSVGALSF